MLISHKRKRTNSSPRGWIITASTGKNPLATIADLNTVGARSYFQERSATLVYSLEVELTPGVVITIESIYPIQHYQKDYDNTPSILSRPNLSTGLVLTLSPKDSPTTTNVGIASRWSESITSEIKENEKSGKQRSVSRKVLYRRQSGPSPLRQGVLLLPHQKVNDQCGNEVDQ